MEKINAAKHEVKNEIHELKEKLKLSRETIDSFKRTLAEAQQSPDKSKGRKEGSPSSSKFVKSFTQVKFDPAKN